MASFNILTIAGLSGYLESYGLELLKNNAFPGLFRIKDVEGKEHRAFSIREAATLAVKLTR